jgi:hypothetical protein
MPQPIHTLPPDYEEVVHLVVTDPAQIGRLNLWGLALIVPFVALTLGWAALLTRWGLYEGQFGWSAWAGLLAIALVVPLHEGVHGLAIRWAGHTPRYGAKFVTLARVKIPYIFYATADQALFRRHEFIVIALAPVVVLTIAGLLAMMALPASWGPLLIVAVIFNGSGAAGDLWMTAIVLRYPESALVRDEADGIRVFARRDDLARG